MTIWKTSVITNSIMEYVQTFMSDDDEESLREKVESELTLPLKELAEAKKAQEVWEEEFKKFPIVARLIPLGPLSKAVEGVLQDRVDMVMEAKAASEKEHE